MERENFEHRNSSFMSTAAQRVLSETRLNRVVTLRKQKRHKDFIFKRLKESHSPPSQATLEGALRQLDLRDLSSVKNFRRLLCQKTFNFTELLCLAPDILELLSPGLVNRQSEVAYEVSWCFTNMALGPEFLANLVAQYVPTFAEFILFPQNKMLAEQGCWVLGNLAADSLQLRNSIRQVCGIIKGMGKLLTFKIPSLSSVACWALCNLIRGPNADFSIFMDPEIYGPVIELTHRPWTSDVCVEALWFVSFLTSSPGDSLYERVALEMPRLLAILTESYEPKVVIPVLRIVGHAFCFWRDAEQLLCDGRLIKATAQFLNREEETQLARDCVWLLGVLFGTSEQCMKFVTGHESFQRILGMLVEYTECVASDIQTEVAISLYNLTVNGYFFRVISMGGVKLLDFYLNLIIGICQFIHLGVVGGCDSDLLWISIDFVAVCLENSHNLDLPQEVCERLKEPAVPEAFIKCLYAFKENKRAKSIEKAIAETSSRLVQDYYYDYLNHC